LIPVPLAIDPPRKPVCLGRTREWNPTGAGAREIAKLSAERCKAQCSANLEWCEAEAERVLADHGVVYGVWAGVIHTLDNEASGRPGVTVA
jgi:hypothetical protein